MRSRRVLAAALAAAGSVLLAGLLVTTAQAATGPEPAPEPQGEVSTFPEVPFTITHDATGLCLAGKAPATGERDGAVVVEACDGGSDQRWTYDVVSKRLRDQKLGVRWCLSADGPLMVRCPDIRSDTYRWLQRDGIYTPADGGRFLGVAGANQVVVAAGGAGTGFDWTVEAPAAATNSAPATPAASPQPASAAAAPAPAAAPLPVAPGGLPLPSPDMLPAPGALPAPDALPAPGALLPALGALPAP